MPSNRNSQDRRRDTVMDVTIIKLVRDFELMIYQYIDKVAPRKFRDTLVKQLVNTLGEAREAAIMSWDIPRQFKVEKYHEMSRALAKMHNAEVLLNLLNDLQTIGDGAKAKIDIEIAKIYGNFNRLLSSYANDIEKDMIQSSGGTPTEESKH